MRAKFNKAKPAVSEWRPLDLGTSIEKKLASITEKARDSSVARLEFARKLRQLGR